MVNNVCRMCQSLTLEGSTKLYNTILWQTEHFVVLPTLGQFIEGWVMVVDKLHSRCSAVLEKGILGELSSLVDMVRHVLESVYGATVVFEHGPGKKSEFGAGCCVRHTHLHIVPCKVCSKFRSLIPFNCYQRTRLEDILEPNKGNGYLLVSANNDINLYNLYLIDTVIPRQYLRQILAVAEDCSQYWDWRLYPFHNSINQTIVKLSKVLTQESPNPILDATIG
jgi:diadenosine tetraphosphate (Ap4A) HIT family hydrolase